MIKTIVFDFGNVVGFFDHKKAIDQFVHHTPLDPIELALALYGSPIEHGYETGLLTTEEYVRQALLNGRLTCPPEVFLQYFCDIFWPNPEVCEIIPRLKGRYRILLASNTNPSHFSRFSTDFAEVLSHFSHLCVSHDAGARKPSEAFFAYCQRFANASPAECLFLDDLAVNVEAAERFGWRGQVYRPDGSLAKKLMDAGVEFTTAGSYNKS